MMRDWLARACSGMAVTLALALAAFGQEEPKLLLSVPDLLSWQPKGGADAAPVPLAARFTDLSQEPDRAARFDPSVRVMLAPDGMDNFGRTIPGLDRFNQYIFTHWPQIDILAWFAGNAAAPVAIPAPPWVEAAHRNGVKVIGTVFFAPVAWGGGADTLRQFLIQDEQGRFPAAERLIAIARHYGFDGWFVNQETGLNEYKEGERLRRRAPTADDADLARKVMDFMRYLKSITPDGMEIHWYDAMLPDGRVGWQNALNGRNLPFLQDGAARTADAMFLNYDWTAQGLRQGAALAEANGRSRYDLFIGADLWPQRNAQPAFRNTHWLQDLRDGQGRAVGSIALFAPNFNFNFTGDERTPAFSQFQTDADDVQRFYDAEVRLFAGDDRNMAASARQGGWEGISTLVPARSALTALPFATSFNTGHGKRQFRQGQPVGGPWHDLSRQDLLPTWQFASMPAKAAHVFYDFDKAYEGGSALRVVPDLALSAPLEVPLYLADLTASGPIRVAVAANAPAAGYSLRLTLSDGRHADLPVGGAPGWAKSSGCLSIPPDIRVRRLSLILQPVGSGVGDLSLGQLSIAAGCLDSDQQVTVLNPM